MFQNILIPTDGSVHALNAAKYGADIASRYGSKVTLLHVVEVPVIPGRVLSNDQLDDLRQGIAQAGNRALKATAEVFAGSDIKPVETLLFGSAVPTILQFAHDGDFDLIIINSRGTSTSAIDQLLLGSVAEGVMHSAPCPVLMIRPE